MLHLVLVEPEIHWNTGNLGRTALAVGAELHLVEPLGFSLDDKQVKRAGLDYWPRVRLRTWPSWSALAVALPALGQPWFFSAAAARPDWDAELAADCVLVFGRESVGLPRAILDGAGERALSIPMQDPALRSLNLSTAAALAAYEWARQQRSRSATPAR
ncbi:MAG: tRNA (cytidine(34)-2'-O)-methyltransferase [Polyangia bacterium]